jgi:hypothetical protein
MVEYPVARAYVDARIQRIYGGANEIMKEVIARSHRRPLISTVTGPVPALFCGRVAAPGPFHLVGRQGKALSKSRGGN